MRIQFIERQDRPPKLLAEAEILFDEDGPLVGMKLVGISVWANESGPHVTFPARSFGVGGERRFFDFLRAAQTGGGEATRLKAWIIAEYERAKSEAA